MAKLPKMKVTVLNGSLCDESIWQDWNWESLGCSIQDVSFPAVNTGESMTAMAERMGENLSSHDENIIVGFSLGAILTLAIARRFPAKIKGIVLLASNPREWGQERESGAVRQRAILAESGLKAVFDDLLLSLYFPQGQKGLEKEVEQIRAMGLRQGGEALKNQLFTLSTREDARKWLSEISCPSLIFYGDQDVLCTKEMAEEVADGINRGINKAEVRAIKDCAHFIPLIRAEEIQEELKKWLKKLS